MTTYFRPFSVWWNSWGFTPFGRLVIGGTIIALAALALTYFFLVPSCYGFGGCDP